MFKRCLIKSKVLIILNHPISVIVYNECIDASINRLYAEVHYII